MRIRNARRGAALVEGAVVFGVLLLFVLATLDLGLAVFRSHLITEAARHGARQAIVRGALADALGTWGPETIGPLAGNDSHPLAQAIQPYLAGFDLDTVVILAEWIDGGTERGMRVRVTVSAPYRPFGPVLPAGGLALRASSTTIITH